MKAKERETKPEEHCDTKIWSGECRHEGANEYLCTACGTIVNLDHEVRHEVFPYVSGDKDILS